ncbi:hypothetical protein CBR_g19809 [Chara braunii]|uniref:Integrase catalytic domain-containing protein n=1 Tax=Chara braunii TaxID=69332 RepID=A0A388JU31_CHABU|nr:hypothetical protein CBR_g19809 [Chara braunii]|eukprot:GBG61277.1 hypothetical protein CBR_g19809 [Chara braunii]
MGPFGDEQGREVLCILRAAVNARPGVPQISDETMWRVIRREVDRGAAYIDDLYRLVRTHNPKGNRDKGELSNGGGSTVRGAYRAGRAARARAGLASAELGKMATEEETDNRKSEGEPGLEGSVAQSEGGQKDRESINPDDTKGNRKEISTWESLGKAGGSRQGTQGTKEGRNKDRTSPRNSEGTMPKKVRVSDTRRRLAEIDTRTAEYKAKLIEEMMTGNEEGPLQEEPRDERRGSQGGTGRGDKGSDRRGTSSKRRKERDNSPGMQAEKATTPPAMDSRASRLPITPGVARGCEGLWSLRERVLGWFDPEATMKTREGQKADKESPDNSVAGEASSSKGGLKKIVSSLARALNKNQGYLVDAKKKLAFDGANIMKFMIDYENLAALLKWTEEEKMDHLGQHVSLSLGRDIMVIVAASRSWKETRDVMMRKYLAAEKMATEANLAAIQRKNFATYNDFLRTVTDLAEKTVVTETLALLKEGEVIDLTGRTSDKVVGSSEPQAEPEAEEPEKVYGKPREEEPADEATAAKKKFRYHIPILTLPELDDTISKLLGTMVSVSFQTMQTSSRVLKGLRQLLTQRRVEIGDNPELPEGEREEEALQEVANLQRSHGDLEDLERAFADIRLSLPDREGSEVMRSPPGTKLSFHALPVRKLKIQIGSHHTDALVDGGAEISLIRRDFATITRCTINKEVTGSIWGAGGEILFTGYVTKCAVRESIWSFQRMTIMEEMNHDIIFGRPWCTNVEMIGMHLHDGSYMVDIEDPVTGRGELLRLLGTEGDPPKGKLATRSPSFEDSTRKGAFARMEGYDQLPLDVRDKPYTAMHTPVGQLQMQVTPMGFTNAVAESQRGMLAVAGDMFLEKCEPYIDDNPIKGAQEKDETEVQPGIRRFVWNHMHDIKDLLRRFLVYNITASGPKTILAVPEVTILRFRCGAYGRKPDPAKTDKISQWPTPLRTTTKVRALLGVVGFWRIFIKNFSKIAEPIRAMIRKEGTMDWTEEREEAVQRLKDILTSETVALSAPCFNDEVGRPFILETDGGLLAVGGVLIQRDEGGKERPIRFESRTLNSAERWYSQFKKEVLAILHCLKTFQAYLFGKRFILRIDLTNVAGALKNYRPIYPTVGRWVGFIWQFDYKIERIAGIHNKADGLSRVCITPEGMEDAEPIDVFLEYEGETLAVDNEMMSEGCTSGELLIQTLEKGAPAVIAELTEGPVTTRGHREENDSWGAIVGPKEELIAMAVEGGREAVMSSVESSERKELQWVVNQMQEGKDGVQDGDKFFYVQSYEGLFREIGLLLVGNKQPMEVSIKAREEVERYILDARDNLSGFVEAVALKKKTGRSVADCIEDFYLRHPFVRKFIADNETKFVNQEVLGMLKRLCVPIKLIEPYHPEANAHVERGHRTLKNTIAKLAADHLGNWPRYFK